MTVVEPSPRLTLAGAPSSLDEDESDDFTVVLNVEPTDDVTVSLSSSETGDATVSPATLTFTADNWETAQTATVTGVEDSDATDDEVTITLDPSGGNYDAAASSVFTVTVIDAPVSDAGLTLASEPSSLDEGASDDFTVVLDAQPTGDVTVDLSSSDEGVATVSRPH